MPLFHIDSVSTTNELYTWADSFDNAYAFAVQHVSMASENLGDIRVRQVMKNTEADQFKQPVKPLHRYYACEAVKK